jgi:hypothetical protein
MLYSMDMVISRKKELKKQALIFNFMFPPLTHDVSHSDDPRIPSRECSVLLSNTDMSHPEFCKG